MKPLRSVILSPKLVILSGAKDLVLALAFLLLVAPSLAFGAQAPLPSAPGISMDYPEAVSIGELVASLGRQLHKNILMDSQVSGKVQIIAPQKLSPDDAYQVLLSALTHLGLTTVETGMVTKIVKIPEGQKRENPLVKNSAELITREYVVTYFLPLTNLSGKDVMTVIGPLGAGQSMTVAPSGNALILCDTGTTIARLLKIISLLDVKTDAEQIEVITPRTQSAEALLPKLKELLQPPAGLSSATPPITMVADAESNALILFGSKLDITRAKDIIREIDQLPEASGKRKGVYVRPIDFADATKLASVVQALSYTDPQGLALAKEDGQHKIVVDKDTNSLLIQGSKDYYRAVDRVIRQLDKRKLLLYFSLEILEISADHGLTLGTAYGFPGSVSTPGEGLRTLTTWQFPQVAPFIPAFQGGQTTVTNATAAAANVSDGITIGALGEGGVDIPGLGKVSPAGLIQLIKTDGMTRSLSSPQLLAIDNEEASISVGEKLFFKTEIKDKRGQPSTSFQPEDVDLQMTIKGHIAGKNYIALDMNLSANTIVGTNPGGFPSVSKKIVKQKVTVFDKQTMVLVGYNRRLDAQSFSKVPVLGDLPFIGLFFRKQNTVAKDARLALFLTTRIIRKSSDFEKIHQRTLPGLDHLHSPSTDSATNVINNSSE